MADKGGAGNVPSAVKVDSELLSQNITHLLTVFKEEAKHFDRVSLFEFAY